MCYPKTEGGLGFKSLHDICLSFSAKRWWRLRTEKSLWADILKAKYCQRSNPMSKVATSKGSSSWRELLFMRDKVEKYICWKVNSGKCYLWWDDWTLQGSLYSLANLPNKPSLKVNIFLQGRDWDLDRLNFIIPGNILNIVKNIHFGNREQNDFVG